MRVNVTIKKTPFMTINVSSYLLRSNKEQITAFNRWGDEDEVFEVKIEVVDRGDYPTTLIYDYGLKNPIGLDTKYKEGKYNYLEGEFSCEIDARAWIKEQLSKIQTLLDKFT